MDVVAELADVVVLGAARFVGQVKKRERVGELLLEKRDPVIGLAPRACPFIKSFSGAIEGARNNAVPNVQTRSFVTIRFGEVASIEPAKRRDYGVDVVGVDQLNALAM